MKRKFWVSLVVTSMSSLVLAPMATFAEGSLDSGLISVAPETAESIESLSDLDSSSEAGDTDTASSTQKQGFPTELPGTTNSSTETSVLEESTETKPVSDSSESETTESSTTESKAVKETEATSEEDEDTFIPEDYERSDLSDAEKPVHRIQVRSFQAPVVQSAVRSIPQVAHNNANTPTKDFVDVSSHNGYLSVANYQLLKAWGVKGVAVKLTEYTTYRNPYAQIQIQNAQAAGLKVSTYHYSWFTTDAGARAEARYYAKFAKELGLPASTIMVNDLEDPEIMGTANHTRQSQIFAEELKKQGYGNTVHYTYLGAITAGQLNANTLGAKNIWIAQYPYSVSKNQSHTQYGAWQWNSRLKFPGIDFPFDISSDYVKKFVTVPKPASYYTSNPGYVAMLKDDCIYKDVNFKTKSTTYKKGTVLKITGITKTSGGTPRLIVNGGYLTANKSIVRQITGNSKNYYTQPATNYIVMLKSDTSYGDANLSKNQVKTKYAAATVLKISGIVYSSTNYPRFKLSNGTYISANRSIVSTITNSYANYMTKVPKQLVLLKNDYSYKNVNLSSNQKKKLYKTGAKVNVKGIAYTSGGTPRFILSDGSYISSNRTIVSTLVTNYQDYYFTNQGYIVLLKNDWAYKEANLKNGSKQYKKGDVLKVVGVAYSDSNYPRFKLSNGTYISGKKTIVSKVTANYSQYFTAAKSSVTLKKNDYFYGDVNLKNRKQAVKKNTKVTVKGIQFTSSGVPRFVTSQGYLTANKSYVK